MDKLRALQAKKAAAAAPKEETKTEETSNGTTTAAPAQQGSLFSLKKGNKTGAKKQNAAQLRAQKGKKQSFMNQLIYRSDIGEMDPVPGTKVIFPDPDNIMKFEVNVTPSDGLYRGATFNFQIEIPTTYPYDPPKALCTTLVYHPNIDWEGRVCLNILRQEWMPVLSLGSVIFGLMTLFLVRSISIDFD